MLYLTHNCNILYYIKNLKLYTESNRILLSTRIRSIRMLGHIKSLSNKHKQRKKNYQSILTLAIEDFIKLLKHLRKNETKNKVIARQIEIFILIL